MTHDSPSDQPHRSHHPRPHGARAGHGSANVGDSPCALREIQQRRLIWCFV
jgi:hypothetical protein